MITEAFIPDPDERNRCICYCRTRTWVARVKAEYPAWVARLKSFARSSMSLTHKHAINRKSRVIRCFNVFALVASWGALQCSSPTTHEHHTQHTQETGSSLEKTMRIAEKTKPGGLPKKTKPGRLPKKMTNCRKYVSENNFRRF